MAKTGNLLETEESGRVVAGAKTQSRVQNNRTLARFSLPPAPAWFDEELPANFNRPEMSFPGFGPIFPAEKFDGELGRPQVDTQPLQVRQSISKEGAQGCMRARQYLGKNRNRYCPRLFTPINGWRHAEGLLQQSAHRLFALGACKNGNLPQTRRDHFNFASVACTAAKFGRSFGVGVCSAYCTMPALSMTNAARADVSPTPASIGKRTS